MGLAAAGKSLAEARFFVSDTRPTRRAAPMRTVILALAPSTSPKVSRSASRPSTCRSSLRARKSYRESLHFRGSSCPAAQGLLGEGGGFPRLRPRTRGLILALQLALTACVAGFAIRPLEQAAGLWFALTSSCGARGHAGRVRRRVRRSRLPARAIADLATLRRSRATAWACSSAERRSSSRGASASE